MATNEQEQKVERVEGIDQVLTVDKTGFENYLLVGSDTREGADPNDPDAGSIGDTTDVQGRRSDTMMLLHVNHDSDEVAIFSIPRDLYVDIPGYGTDRINSAYFHGEDVLISTIQESLGIPVHHYIEVDFFGFKDIVDAIGGVEACFNAPTRDKNTGLAVPTAGCFTLDGVQGLQYARSRYYERVRRRSVDDGPDGGPRPHRTAAGLHRLGDRQGPRAVAGESSRDELDRGVRGRLGARGPGTNLIDAANELRPLADGGLATYRLPVVGATIDGKSVLELDEGALRVLAYFAGTGPAPADLENG